MTERRKGLGRGLSALLPKADETVRSLPIGQLTPNRLQPRTRFEDDGLTELAESIKTQGMIQPIIVKPLESGVYTIIAGERRWRAAQRAGLATVPIVIRPVTDDRELLELALVENIQRSDLNAVEEAEAFRRLADDFDLGHEAIAARVGKSRAAVSNSMRLLKLPTSVLELLRAGRLTAGQARPLLALETAAEIERLARRAAEEGLSARAIEALTNAARSPERRSVRAASAPDANTAAAAEKLTQRLQTKVEIVRRGRGGVIRMHFHSEEELMRLFDRLG